MKIGGMTMTLEELRRQCLSVKGAAEGVDINMVNYKIMGKVFAFFPLAYKNSELFVVLKCAPEKSAALRENYKGVTKGWYSEII